MNFGWLRDFMAVAELGSFSRAAEARSITQPAMSRHIKGLEDQLGFQLIDRSVFPASLTASGEQFYNLSLQVLEDFENGVSGIRQQAKSASDTVRFAMQHVLAGEFFSSWWHRQKQSKESLTIGVEAIDLHDCVQKLEDGHIDLLICYQPEGEKLALDPAFYGAKKIGTEQLIPVSALGENGKLIFDLSGPRRIPLASAGESDFMGKVVNDLIRRQTASERFIQVYEDSFSLGVRSQVLAGAGLGWLPAVLVARDLEDGKLAIAGSEHWHLTLDIYLYAQHSRLKGPALSIWNDVT